MTPDVLYYRLMANRPKSAYHTYNKVDRSHTVTYQITDFYLLFPTLVVCTQYADGTCIVNASERVPVTHKHSRYRHLGTLTRTQAHAIYQHAMKYCK